MWVGTTGICIFPLWEHSLCKKREEMPFLEKFSEVVVVTSSRLVPPWGMGMERLLCERRGRFGGLPKIRIPGVIEGAGGVDMLRTERR